MTPGVVNQRLLIINSQPLFLHQDGWRGDGWQDFADSIAAHFRSAVLWVPARVDGGETFDLHPMEHVRVEPAPYAYSFIGILRGLFAERAGSVWRQLVGLVRAHDLVLLRAPSPLLPVVALLCRWYGRRLVVAVTGDIMRSNRYIFSRRRWQRAVGAVVGGLLRLIEKLSMLTASVVFAYGEDAARSYRRFARVCLTREGPLWRNQIVRRDDACAGPRIRILQVAGQHRNKNLPMLFRAAVRLVERGVDLELHLAGSQVSADPEVAEIIEKASRSAALEGRVVNHGWLRQTDLLALYRRCDLLTLTSMSEGWPRVLSEGASFGLPLVSTAVGGIPTFLRDGVNGLLVAPDDDVALSVAIGRVIDDEPLRRRLVEGGYALAASGCREEIVREWVHEMTAGAPPPLLRASTEP